MMAASARVEKALLFAASKLGYETLKEEQKKAVRAFVAGNDVFVTHDGHNPASVQQSPLMVIRICNSTDSASVLGAAGHLNTAALATLRTLPRARGVLSAESSCGYAYVSLIIDFRYAKIKFRGDDSEIGCSPDHSSW